MSKKDTLIIKYSKKEQDYVWFYPNAYGKYLGYKIINEIKKIEKDNPEYDFKTLKITVKMSEDSAKRE